MYTKKYLNTLSASQVLDLINDWGFPSLSESLENNEGTRQNHVDDLARAYRQTSDREFSFLEYCKVEQLLFTYFDLVNYQPTTK